MSESGRGDSAKLLDYVSQTQLRLANFILKHLWPTPFVLDHCVKNITECDEEDSAAEVVVGALGRQRKTITIGSCAEGLSIPDYRSSRPDAPPTYIVGRVDQLVSEKNWFRLRPTDLDKNKTTPRVMEDYIVYIETLPDIPLNYAALKLTNAFKRACSAIGKPMVGKYLLNIAPLTSESNRLCTVLPGFMETASPATETSARDAAVKAKMAEKNICWGIEFTHWPQVANAWKYRERPSGWPSIQAINEVLDGGFHMLPIGVSDNKELRRLEWRYSFAVAEKLLAKHHLPPVARKVYIYLRLLQVHFFSDPPMIPTYFMQNFFLWLLEKWPVDSWDDDKLADILLLVIDELIEAVKQRDIRHYFIPEVNLLVDLPPTFAGIISAKILHVRHNLVACLLAIDDCVTFRGLHGRKKGRLLLAVPIRDMTTVPLSPEQFNRNQRVGLQALVHGTLEVLGRICEQLSTEEDPRVVLHLRAQLNTFVRVTYDLWGAQHGQGVHTMLGGHTLLEFVFESLLLSSLPPLLICKALHFLQADAYCRQLFECDGSTVSPSNAYKRLDKGNLADNIRSKLRVTLSMLELMESDPITDNAVLYRGKNENVKSTDMGLTMRFTINNPDGINKTQ